MWPDSNQEQNEGCSGPIGDFMLIFHSKARKPSSDEEPGIKSDILKREGTFSPLEQQSVDMSDALDQLRKEQQGKQG